MKQLSALALSILSLGASAQLSVTTNLSETDIAQLLEGLNVSIEDVTVNCAGTAMGHFSGTSELSITEGLVLTTGDAAAVAGPVGNFASGMPGTPGDPDLEAAVGMATYDGCVLEFDCIPLGDTLLFNFSFGSEEYSEFVNTGFNDVFAIYLSGPGFNGPTNVAALPDGTPVAINNVNAGMNSAYFHDNEAGFGVNVSYDGFTNNLTTFAVVSPEETYHFKVAIADVSDGVFDSGVFLEAFSFRSVFGITLGMEEPALSALCTPYGWQVGVPAGHLGQELVVTNMTGGIVKRMRIADERMSFDLDGVGQGLYLVRVLGDRSLAPVRIVKQ